MRIVTVFIVGMLCLAKAGAQEAQTGMAPDAPFDFDTAPGRLPKTVIPLAYTLDLVPDLDHNRTRGHETVQLDFRQQVESLRFNTLGERLDHVRLDGRSVARVDTDDAAQLTTVSLGKMVKPGRHVLTLDYSGTIETRPFGLYLQQYRRPDGTTERMLSSKFEATDARRMFPCWDEPAFRATLKLTMTIPANWSAVASRRHRACRAIWLSSQPVISPPCPASSVQPDSASGPCVASKRAARWRWPTPN
jgi:aminopeptidase N